MHNVQHVPPSDDANDVDHIDADDSAPRDIRIQTWISDQHLFALTEASPTAAGRQSTPSMESTTSSASLASLARITATAADVRADSPLLGFDGAGGVSHDPLHFPSPDYVRDLPPPDDGPAPTGLDVDKPLPEPPSASSSSTEHDQSVSALVPSRERSQSASSTYLQFLSSPSASPRRQSRLPSISSTLSLSPDLELDPVSTNVNDPLPLPPAVIPALHKRASALSLRKQTSALSLRRGTDSSLSLSIANSFSHSPSLAGSGIGTPDSVRNAVYIDSEDVGERLGALLLAASTGSPAPFSPMYEDEEYEDQAEHDRLGQNLFFATSPPSSPLYQSSHSHPPQPNTYTHTQQHQSQHIYHHQTQTQKQASSSQVYIGGGTGSQVYLGPPSTSASASPSPASSLAPSPFITTTYPNTIYRTTTHPKVAPTAAASSRSSDESAGPLFDILDRGSHSISGSTPGTSPASPSFDFSFSRKGSASSFAAGMSPARPAPAPALELYVHPAPEGGEDISIAGGSVYGYEYEDEEGRERVEGGRRGLAPPMSSRWSLTSSLELDAGATLDPAGSAPAEKGKGKKEKRKEKKEKKDKESKDGKDGKEKEKEKMGKRKRLVSFISRLSGAPSLAGVGIDSDASIVSGRLEHGDVGGEPSLALNRAAEAEAEQRAELGVRVGAEEGLGMTFESLPVPASPHLPSLSNEYFPASTVRASYRSGSPASASPVYVPSKTLSASTSMPVLTLGPPMSPTPKDNTWLASPPPPKSKSTRARSGSAPLALSLSIPDSNAAPASPTGTVSATSPISPASAVSVPASPSTSVSYSISTSTSTSTYAPFLSTSPAHAYTSAPTLASFPSVSSPSTSHASSGTYTHTQTSPPPSPVHRLRSVSSVGAFMPGTKDATDAAAQEEAAPAPVPAEQKRTRRSMGLAMGVGIRGLAARMGLGYSGPGSQPVSSGGADWELGTDFGNGGAGKGRSRSESGSRSRGRGKTALLGSPLPRGKKRKLVISGIPEVEGSGSGSGSAGDEGEGPGYEAVKAWCEGFGEVRAMKRTGRGCLVVDFRKASVADTVCRVQAQVYIKGAGSVNLSWYTKSKKGAL